MQSPSTLTYVAPDEGQTVRVMGDTVTFKVRAAETRGRYALIQTLLGPGSGLGLHTNPEEVTLVALEGTIEFTTIADAQLATRRPAAGGVIHVPAGVPYGFRNAGATPAEMLLITAPRMEDFLFERSAVTDVEPAAALFAKYGLGEVEMPARPWP